MDLKELKRQVYEGNLELVRRGLVIYTWGNVSAIDRAAGLVAIKPRGVEYADLTADDMSVVDLTGKQIGKGLLPSVDLDIHLELYRAYPRIGGVAHTHSTWATAWAQAGRSIPVMGTTHGDHFYGDIICTRQLASEEVTAENYELQIGRSIVEAFGDIDPMTNCAVLAHGHGPFTWGDNADSAVQHSVILEELAKMAKLTKDIAGKDIRLPRAMLDKHYLRKYGANAYFYQSKNDGEIRKP